MSQCSSSPSQSFSLISQPASIPGSQRNHAVLLNFTWAVNVKLCVAEWEWARERKKGWQKNWVKRKKNASAHFLTHYLSQPDKGKWHWGKRSKRLRERLCTDINMLHTLTAETLQLLCSVCLWAPRLWFGRRKLRGGVDWLITHREASDWRSRVRGRVQPLKSQLGVENNPPSFPQLTVCVCGCVCFHSF